MTCSTVLLTLMPNALHSSSAETKEEVAKLEKKPSSIISLLLSIGGLFKNENRDRTLQFIDALSNNKPDEARKLLALGIDVNMNTNFGSPLYIAAQDNKQQC